MVSEPLVVKNEIANCGRKLLSLPLALQTADTLGFAFRSGFARGLDRIGCSPELVGSDMSY